eukprot:GHVS01083165.1.p1 GENE.GHVS01083165.1~~GHVS01083165.1.p1  ORF type:complete len:764 (+),score=109.16 GHVS01083165.1:125-2293(+)
MENPKVVQVVVVDARFEAQEWSISYGARSDPLMQTVSVSVHSNRLEIFYPKRELENFLEKNHGLNNGATIEKDVPKLFPVQLGHRNGQNVLGGEKALKEAALSDESKVIRIVVGIHGERDQVPLLLKSTVMVMVDRDGGFGDDDALTVEYIFPKLSSPEENDKDHNNKMENDKDHVDQQVIKLTTLGQAGNLLKIPFPEGTKDKDNCVSSVYADSNYVLEGIEQLQLATQSDNADKGRLVLFPKTEQTWAALYMTSPKSIRIFWPETVKSAKVRYSNEKDNNFEVELIPGGRTQLIYPIGDDRLQPVKLVIDDNLFFGINWKDDYNMENFGLLVAVPRDPKEAASAFVVALQIITVQVSEAIGGLAVHYGTDWEPVFYPKTKFTTHVDILWPMEKKSSALFSNESQPSPLIFMRASGESGETLVTEPEDRLTTVCEQRPKEWKGLFLNEAESRLEFADKRIIMGLPYDSSKSETNHRVTVMYSKVDAKSDGSEVVVVGGKNVDVLSSEETEVKSGKGEDAPVEDHQQSNEEEEGEAEMEVEAEVVVKAAAMITWHGGEVSKAFELLLPNGWKFHKMSVDDIEVGGAAKAVNLMLEQSESNNFGMEVMKVKDEQGDGDQRLDALEEMQRVKIIRRDGCMLILRYIEGDDYHVKLESVESENVEMFKPIWKQFIGMEVDGVDIIGAKDMLRKSAEDKGTVTVSCGGDSAPRATYDAPPNDGNNT